ncbi:MAG: zf-HC2 domain-containing protein [Deltaproteobacteria bacterium]|nr:zf-HC2 domain-containing protein [Deltaproteobacteria bacterium]
MTHSYSNTCDEILIVRYLDGDLEAGEKERMETHIEACRQCRRQVVALRAFSQDLRLRVHHATDSVDFVALEKQVLNKALRQYRSRGGFPRFIASLKYILPATVTAGVLLFFVYSNFVARPAPVPVPSAIINSFTGSMSSVMIFETPETRQTILWYNEDTDVKSEQNAV